MQKNETMNYLQATVKDVVGTLASQQDFFYLYRVTTKINFWTENTLLTFLRFITNPFIICFYLIMS